MASAAPPEFRGRIDRRLVLVFGALFALVLTVGGTSLYLLGSLLLRSEQIGRESEQVHLVERLHRMLQDFLSAIQLAHLQDRPLPDSLRTAYAADLASVVTLYRAAGGSEQIAQDVRDIIATAEALAARAAAPARDATRAAGMLGPQDLAVLEATQQRVRALTDRVTAGHGASEERQVQQTYRQLRITIGVNIAFVIAGVLLLLASQRYFRRAIALPLRRLTDRASEIAQGHLHGTTPVASSDDIGRLSHAFNRMAEQLREHEERLQGLAIVEERERLARELHDSLAQDLAFLRLRLIEADRSLVAPSHAETGQLVREMFTIVDGAYQNLRQAIFGLHALDLTAPGGLVGALTEYLDAFSELRGIPVSLEVADPDACRLSPRAEAQLVRIIHEALTNIAKHADASKASVRIERAGDAARITIADDGQGFAVDAAPAAGLHFGLRGMRKRAAAVGGRLDVETSPGHGTRVIVHLPIEGG